MELDDLRARADELETRLAWQDQTIEELNQAIAEQALSITRLEDALRLLSERLKAAGAGNDGASASGHEPPPHY